MKGTTQDPPTLTSAAALAAGWTIDHTPSGRTRVVDPRGQRYRRTWHRERADLVIAFRDAGVPPLQLVRCELPAHLRRRRRSERAETQRRQIDLFTAGGAQ